MKREHFDVESDLIARFAEVARMINEDPDLQTDFNRYAYALMLIEMHDLGYIEDADYLLFLRAICPAYYLEQLLHDETTQKMYLRCQYEARTFGAHRDLFPSDASTNSLSYHGG